MYLWYDFIAAHDPIGENCNPQSVSPLHSFLLSKAQEVEIARLSAKRSMAEVFILPLLVLLTLVIP